MKRIEFIAPVEAIRGNMSGKQTLFYAENDNPAYDAPVGQRNYARNYRPSFIGAKKASNGLKYFSVKTKSAVGLSTKAKKAMALLGGAGAIYASIIGDKTTQPYTQLLPLYENWVERGGKGTFRKWCMNTLREGLKLKQATILFAAREGGSLQSVEITNPWNYIGNTPNVSVSQAVLIKFWAELVANPVTFYVDGEMGVAHTGEAFELLQGKPYNILRITGKSVPGHADNIACIDNAYLTLNGEAVESAATIAASNYTLVAFDPA